VSGRYKTPIQSPMVLLSSSQSSHCLCGCNRPASHGIKIFFLLAQQPPVGQDFLSHEVSRSHTTAHHSR